jgi:exosortase
MQSIEASKPVFATHRSLWQQSGWALLCVVGVLLWASILDPLWHEWMGDPSLSHGPLVVILAGILLWMQRDALRRWESATPVGLACLIFWSIVFVGAVFADIVFLKPLALIGMAAGTIWFLGGWKAFASSIGALGLLVFMIPWPTTFIDRIGFPLQLMSSSYAALLGGLCGLPIHQDGVQLAIMPDPIGKPIYSILIAQKCSGLTSLMVLLALGYLIAYHTDVKLGWRALMLAAVVPLALFTNVVRLTFILLAGGHSSPAVAQWIHDHEGPVLIFFCSMGLMAVRHGLLAWIPRTPAVPEATVSKRRDAANPDTAPEEDRKAPFPAGTSDMFVMPGGSTGNQIATPSTSDRK